MTSWPDFQRYFGSYFGADKYLPYAVQGFFENGGNRCFIGRIVKKFAAPAETKLKAATTDVLTVVANGEGTWGNDIKVKITKGRDSGFRLLIYYDSEIPVEDFDNLSVDDTSTEYYEKKVNAVSNFIRLVKKGGDSGGEPDIGHTGTAQTGAAGSITLAATALATDDAYTGMGIMITDGAGKGQKRKITDYTAARVATVNSNWNPVPDNTSKYELYWTLKDGKNSLQQTGIAQDGGAATITLATEASGDDDFYNGMQIEITAGTGINQKSLITDYVGTTKVATVAPWVTEPDNTSAYLMTEPTTLVLADFLRDDTSQQLGKRKGLEGFKEIDEISIVYVPNSRQIAGLAGALISHCEETKYRFAILTFWRPIMPQ